MLAAQLGPCRPAPTPARCRPSHGGQGVLAKPPVSRGGAGGHAPVAHAKPSGGDCTCKRTIAQQGVASHTGGCWGLWQGGLGSEPHAAGSKRIAAFLPQTKTEAFCWQDPEGKKQNLPSVWLKITCKGLVSVFSGSGSIPVPDHYLLKQCQAGRKSDDRVRRPHAPCGTVAFLSCSVSGHCLSAPTKEGAGR